MAAYITRAEFVSLCGLTSQVTSQLADDRIAEKTEHASRIADGYLMSVAKTPYTAPAIDLKMRVAWIAAYFVMSELGFNPEVPGDTTILKNYSDAIAWLRDVASGRVALLAPTDQTPDIDEGRPDVTTDTPRGW